jgi:hypothetical protein
MGPNFWIRRKGGERGSFGAETGGAAFLRFNVKNGFATKITICRIQKGGGIENKIAEDKSLKGIKLTFVWLC